MHWHRQQKEYFLNQGCPDPAVIIEHYHYKYQLSFTASRQSSLITTDIFRIFDISFFINQGKCNVL
jgi:hypothetical protein